jgi:large subunit ribosomal protein L10
LKVNFTIVHDGDTKLAPGPIVSELAQFLKVQTMVKNGTIWIKNEAVTHKAGTIIDAKSAELLARLGIQPVDIKLDLYGAWSNGNIISTEILHVNTVKIEADVRLAASQALNLAMSVGIITQETAVPLVTKAARIARGVAMKLPIVIPELTEAYVQQAVREANVVKKNVPNLE